MYKQLLTALVMSMLILPVVHAQKPKKGMYTPNAPVSPKYQVDPRIDNMSYWRRMASLGLVPVEPETKAPPAVYGTSKLIGRGVMTEDSEDVPVTTQNSTQSENSIFVNPQNPEKLLQSNNSTGQPASNLYGANSFLSTDNGATWGGTIQGAGGSNSGDPTTAISLSGRYYVNFIHSSGGQGIAYSTNQGQSWTSVLIASSPGGWGSLLDKNHMWIDNSPTSPYEGNLYCAWTNFGGSNDSDIEISRSTDEGLTWSPAVNISNGMGGSHCQGVNITTGPNGEVYVIWSVYDAFPQDEKAIGFTKSTDGGVTWSAPVRIINNTRGIRSTGVGKNHRVNAFPTATCDISTGPNRGNIYVSWANIGTPGINTGSDCDVYVIKSTNGGTTWSSPIRANQDPAGLGKKHYFPWITSDPTNGFVSIVYYDDRNVGSTQDEVYTSNSSDGGETWWDLKVSDVSFTPAPIPGLADGYMGDYLANHARDGWVYPTWADNRLGHVMTFVSPFVTGPPPNQPWLVYNDNTIEDTPGNGNGLLDYGESSQLTIGIENQGDTPATAVNVVLTTDNPYVTITDNTELYGDIAVGAIVSVPSAFSIDVANNIPDAEQVIFTLAATDINDSTYISNFSIEAHAPAFKTGLITLTEVTGNGNNRLDPNEDANIRISTINTGDYKAYDVNAQLTTSSPYITILNPVVHYDSIVPGPMNLVLPLFDIHVDEGTPIGHYAEFTYQVNSQYHSMTKVFRFPVGLILEDWETGTFTNFEWQFAGSSTWQITGEQKYEGAYSAKSGTIGHNASSEMKLSYNVMTADSISFYVKTSSETSYDYLKFYVNNTMLGQWAGETNWMRVAFPVNAGQQTFRWVYSKDANTVGGQDAAWVDYIVFPPLLQTTAYAGPNGATCERESYLLNGAANNSVSTLWTTSGDGTFDNSASLTCFYTPGVQDIINGSATLTLTVNGPEGEIKTDQMVLTITGSAIITPMTDMAFCTGAPVPVSATVSQFTTLSWSTSGTGTFTDPGNTSTIYQPSAEDYAAGSVTLTLTAQSASPCGETAGALQVSFLPLPTATLPADQTICAGETAAALIALTGTAPWSFEIPGIGVIETSDNPYTLSVSPTATTTYSMNYIADGNSCQNNVEGTFTVTVNPLPVVTVSEDSTICTTESYTLVADGGNNVSYLWTPGNSTASSVTITGSTAGVSVNTYTVQVTDITTGCKSSATATVTVEDCTGINQMAGSDLVIYPNPSKGQFSISLNRKAVNDYRLEMYDVTNKLVYSVDKVTINASGRIDVNVSNLNEGVYTIYLKNDDNALTGKIIIRK